MTSYSTLRHAEERSDEVSHDFTSPCDSSGRSPQNDEESKLKRCAWCIGDGLYTRYHDEQWGVPTRERNVLFEFLVLESAQAGLSWITVLRKRENYRRLYANFDVETVARFGEAEIETMLKDPGIIRNRMKIEASVNNAKRFLEVEEEFGSFADYIWAFVDNKPIINDIETISQIPPKNPLTTKITKDLKKRGFKFLGETIVYAYMQAIGMVDDHVNECFKKTRK